MFRNLVATLILFSTCSAIFAQTENPNLPQTNAAPPVDYSESVAYQPREIKSGKKSKEKKEKKAKDDSARQMSADASQNAASENPAPAENKLIRIPVAVFDGTNAVWNFKQSEFKIYADDKEQEISSFGISVAPLNVVLLFDVSPSAAAKIEAIQNYAARIIAHLRPQDKVMIIKFDERAEVLSDLTGDRQETIQAIKKLKFGDGTSLYDAVEFSLQKLDAQIVGRNLVILLTDGVDTTSRKAGYKDSLLAVEKSDVAFFPVYLDTMPDVQKLLTVPVFVLAPNVALTRTDPRDVKAMRGEYNLGRMYLDDIARSSGGSTVLIRDFSTLQKTGFETIFEAARREYFIGFRLAEGEQSAGRKQIKVRVNRPNLAVKARGSYIVGSN